MTMMHRSLLSPWRDLDRFLQPTMPGRGWTPAFDIEETDAAYVLRGDVPGTAPEDVEVRFEDAVLTVRGERKASGEDLRFRRVERVLGQFERRFRLPPDVDAEGVKASHVNGVLEVTLPKRAPKDTSRLIPVN